MQKVFGIGIPTLNRADILLPFLHAYSNDFPNTKIVILDNGSQSDLLKIEGLYPNIELLQMSTNTGVANAWNLICEKLFYDNKIPNALILNDDVYLGKKESDINFLLKKNKHLYRSTQDWCSFLIPKTTFDFVGKFDTKFYPAYYEDSDYEYRMKIMQMAVYETPLLNPYFYQSNKTLEKAPHLRKLAESNKAVYIEKWGGEPKKEKFIKPYNN